MKKCVVILAVTLSAFSLSNVALAENQGIEARNYRLSTQASDLDYGNRISISGGVRLPIANYTGAFITGRYSDFDGKNYYFDSSTKSATLGIFFRKYDLGIIELDYGYSRTEFDPTVDNSKNSINSFSFSGTYYFDEFDVSLERSKAELDSRNRFNISNASISYYANDNLKLGASVIKMDADGSALFISYQPELFGNNMAISASFQNSDTNDAATISVSYYFDTKVSLKDRVRKY